MTIDQLVDLPAADWSKVSETELKFYLEPYLTVTRPVKRDEKAATNNKNNKIQTFRAMSSARRNEVIAQAIALEKRLKEMNK